MQDDGMATFHVVDGKQRLETILLFVDNELKIAADYGDTALQGKKWSDLAGESKLKSRFWNYILPVEYIENVEGVVVEEVFERLNRNSRKLERQELRHAKFDGWLVGLSEAEAEKDEWQKWKVSTTARARRMRDVQFISELLLVIIEGKQFGFGQDFLDAKYAEYEAPVDTVPGFAEVDIMDRLSEIKQLVTELERENGCVTEYANTFNSFFTLWSLIALNESRLPDTGEFAIRYAGFMGKVAEIISQDDLEQFLDGVVREDYSNALTYYENSRGASTDLQQRETRLNALDEETLDRA